jgi:para-nitrobenzyl esterase
MFGSRRGRLGVLVVSAGVVVLVAIGLIAGVGFLGAGSRAEAASPAPVACTSGTSAQTQSGPVCGVTANGVTSYLGIRYAAPPVGRLRWKPPRPVAPWTQTFQATEAGNICPGPSVTGGPPEGSEDCLNLNVQVPAGATGSSRLPVMVQIHGGGFLDPIGPPDGTHLVSAGHVVFVAMNYRLGILGFMANRALGRHSGDYGLQDQQAALRWTQRNIARFGGDPHNVTILGQSAGGASVCANVASPTARGLFQRGIPESGFYNAATGPQQVWEAADCKSRIPTQRQAERAGARFARTVGCAPSNVGCLRAVPADRLVEAGGKVNDPTAGGTSATIAPTINGTTLPMSPYKAFRTGHINHVGLMNGVDRDEFNGFGSAQSPHARTPSDYRRLVRRQYGRLAPRVFRIYRLRRFPSPFVAYRTVVADSDSVCPALVADRRLSRYIPVYAWQNDDADMPTDFWPSSLLDPTQPNGAYHIAADPFLFPKASVTLSPDQAVLAKQFTNQAVGYARRGNPTARHTPLWTRFTRRRQRVMTLVPAGDSAMTPAETIALQHHCRFWDAVTPTS